MTKKQEKIGENLPKKSEKNRENIFWVRFEFQRYIADTISLDAEAQGALWNLILAYYANGGPIANNDTKLAMLAKMQPSRWRRIKDTILAFFTDTGEGTILHEQAENDMAAARDLRQKRQEAAREANQRRWEKHRSRIDPKRNPIGIANGQPNGIRLGSQTVSQLQSQLQSEIQSSPPPSSSNSEPVDSSGSRGLDALGGLDSGVLNQIDEIWTLYPKKLGWSEGLIAIHAAIRRHGFEAVRDGTRKIAESAAQQRTPIPGQYLPKASEFFDGSRYFDDPAQYGPRTPKVNTAELRRSIDEVSRQADEHVGNPANTEGSLDRKRESFEDWCRLKEQLKAMRAQLADALAGVEP